MIEDIPRRERQRLLLIKYVSIKRCLWQEVGRCFIVIIVGSVISDSAKCLVDIHGPKVKVVTAMLMG